MTIAGDDRERILDAVETIEASIAILVNKQSVSQQTYRTGRKPVMWLSAGLSN
jgi:hypothetical protein